VANPNIVIDGIDEVIVGAGRIFDVPTSPNVPVPVAPTVTNVVSEAALAERGGQALANAYSEYFLDTLQAEIDLAAESALRRSDDAAAVTRALGDYEIEGIRVGTRRAEEAVTRAAARIAAAATFNMPEILVTASRVVGGIPFTLATGLVEGAYYLGSWLSDQAYRSALDRLPPPRPPAAGTAPPPARTDDDPVPPVLVIPDEPETVDVTAPRPVAQPLTPTVPTYLNPLLTPVEPFFSVPTSTPTSSPTMPLPGLTYDPLLVNPPRVSTPTASPVLPPFVLATPLGVPGLVDVSTPGGRAPPRVPSPTNQNRCRCDEPKKKRKKKKPREVCYRGEYVERKKGLLKFRERKVPCQ